MNSSIQEELAVARFKMASDRQGNHVGIGDLVRYAFDREDPWTSERRGIVVGIFDGYNDEVHVRVSPINRTGQDGFEWSCPAESLDVLFTPVYLLPNRRPT